MSMSDRDGFIWQDGKLVPWREATTHVLTHSLHYGMGVFEGVRAYKTESGTAIFRLKEHTERLFRSAHIFQMQMPHSIEEINEAHRTGVYMSGGLYGDPESIAAFEARTMPEAAQALDAGLAELAEQHEARLMERDESFSGEVVAEIEREDDGRAYVIEADGERVMVPEIEGAEMEVGDDVTVSRDPQGVYEAEAGYDYGR